MADKINARRDTAANWTSVNPTMALGEIGLETDTARMKFGDGSTAWTSLVYTPDLPGCRVIRITSSTTVANGAAIPFNGEDYDDLSFHDNSTNPEDVVIPTGHSGRYHLSAGFQFTGANQHFIRIKVGSAEVCAIYLRTNLSLTNQMNVACVTNCNAGDIITAIVGRADSGSTSVAAVPVTFLSVQRIK